MSGHLYKLINDESTPFLVIERMLNYQLVTDPIIGERLALRNDTPQYIRECISMTATDPRCLRAIFAEYFRFLDINNMCSWFCISKRTHLYRGLSEQLISLAEVYL